MTINEANGHLTDAQIEELRVIVGRLPSDYEEFLKQFNGGWPEPDVITIQRGDKPYEVAIDRFFEFRSGDSQDIEKTISVYRDRIPDGTMPVAHDPGGNLILLSLRSVDYGHIYYWDHNEETEEGVEPSMANVFFIATSFKNFLDQLHS
jgi:SMI1-KNR4 cell-wall